MMDGKDGKPHKGLAALIIGGPPHDGEDGEGEEHEEEDDEAGLDAAAEDLISAVHEKDPEAVKAALRSFVEQCMHDYDEDEEHEEGE